MASPLTIQGTGVSDQGLDDRYTDRSLIGMGEAGGEALSRSLVKFDLTDIPAGATIDSAVMTLYYTGQDYSENARAIYVYRVKRAWVQGEANWVRYAVDNNWATAGCANTSTDRESTNIGNSPTQSANPVEDVSVVFTLDASKIEEMIPGGVFTNNGFLLKVATESSDFVYYKNSLAVTSTSRPKLVVTYTPALASQAVWF